MKTASWHRSKGLALAALLVSSVALAAPVPSEATALKEVPAGASLVVHVRGIQGVAERFVDLLKQIAPQETAGVRAVIENFLRDGLGDGRKFRGLAKDGPIFVVFTDVPKPGVEARFAVIAAVTNYRQFADNILTAAERQALKKDAAGWESTTVPNGNTLYLLERKGYAVLTETKELVEPLTRRPTQGLDSRISKEQATRLLAGDVGVYVSMDQFNKEYAEQIKMGKNLVEQGVKATKESVDKVERSQLEMLERAIEPTFQAIEDSQGLLLSLELRPAGLALHVQTEVRGGSSTGKFLSEARIAPFPELDRLPSGMMFYTGIQPSPALFHTMRGAMFGVLANLEGKEMKEAREAVEQLIKANPEHEVGATTMPASGLQRWLFADARAAMAAQMKLLQSLASGGGYLGGILKEKPAIQPKAQQYGAFEFTSVRLVWDLEKMIGGAAHLGEAQKQLLLQMMKKMMGEEITIWYGTDGKQVVQVQAPNWEAAQKLLDADLKGQAPIGPEGNFRAVRKELPTETSVVMLVDLVHYLAALAEMTRPMWQTQFPLPANFPPPVGQGKQSFVGLAFTLVPQRGSVDGFLSTQALKDAFETFVQPFLK